MYRKIDATDGTSYTYEFADGSKYTIHAGAEEVTEEMIKSLKRADNREYEHNLKNWGPEMSLEQKREWKREHPGEKPPRLWNAYLDYGSEYEKNDAEKSLYHQMKDNSPSDNYDYLYEAIDLLPPKQKHVIELLLEGYSQSEIARMLNRSTSTIRDQFNGAKKNIRKVIDDPQ